MDLADIAALRASHKAPDRRAIHAGYDIIYVYAAYDLSILIPILSATANKRTDEYRVKFENRFRLLTEVFGKTVGVAQSKAAVALRFSIAESGEPDGPSNDGEGRDAVEALSELSHLWDVNLSVWPNDSAAARFAGDRISLSAPGRQGLECASTLIPAGKQVPVEVSGKEAGKHVGWFAAPNTDEALSSTGFSTRGISGRSLSAANI